MYVNSPGGSVTAGMAVFDTMRFIRPDVSTVCVGLAASMGAFLLASGAQGKRYSLPNSRIMIHQPLGGAQGQAADIEIQANEILHHKLTLNGYLAEFSGEEEEKEAERAERMFFPPSSPSRDETFGEKKRERKKTHPSFLFLPLPPPKKPTGQSLERITADTDRDFFMSAEEAVDYGLVDAVVSRPYFSSDIPFSQKQAQRSAAAARGETAAVGNRAARVLLPKDLGGDRVLAFAVTKRAGEMALEASEAATKKAERELVGFAPVIQRTVGDIAQYTGRISGNRAAADAAADAAIKAFKEMDEYKDGKEPEDRTMATPAIAMGIKAMNESLEAQGGCALLRPQDIIAEDPEVKRKRNVFLKEKAESMRASREGQ